MSIPVDYLSDPDTVPKAEIPDVLVTLEALRVKLFCRLAEPGDTATRPELLDKLVTVQEAADRLSFTPQLVYGLVRKGQLSAVRQGKYVRIRLSDLSRWMDKHTDKPLDTRLYQPYNRSHGRKRTPGNQKAARAYSSTDGRADRRAIQHGSPVGTERVTDIRTHLKADPPTCTDGSRAQDERIG